MRVWQRYLAELFGTYILVFVGTTSIVAVVHLGGGSPELVAPFAFGLALMGGLYAFAEVSGGHFNPAVSLGLFLDRRINLTDLVGYWVFQFLGAILASLTVLLAFTKHEVAATATVPGPGVGDGAAFVVEVAMTAIFVLVILQSTRSSRFGGSALVAIPLTLLAIHFAAIPLTGSSVNPARTLGPALVGNHWDSEWVYFLGPALGALIASVVYSVVIKGDVSLKGEMTEAPASE
jgi:aquaporin Z